MNYLQNVIEFWQANWQPFSKKENHLQMNLQGVPLVLTLQRTPDHLKYKIIAEEDKKIHHIEGYFLATWDKY